MRYFKKIIGERIYLSPINIDDAEVYTKWMNDYEVSGSLGNFGQMITLSSEKSMLEKLTAEGQNFAIVLLENDRLIGNIGIMYIDHINRKAEVGLFIGEPENRSMGYGAEALRLALKYGFETLNLHNIMLHVHSDNQRAIACYKKVGFREFGRRREAVFKNGNYFDLIHMEILDTDYQKS